MMFSVIVPIYNVQEYLEKCIESILEQSYKDFELLLIDDESTDQSAEICDAYAKKDNRIVVIHKTNGGVSAARNTGIRNAKGNYVVFVDGDDFIDKDYLNAFVQYAEKGIDYIQCGYKRVKKDGEIICIKPVRNRNEIMQNDENRYKEAVRVITMRNGGWEVWRTAIRLDFLKGHSIDFIEGYNYGEDLVFSVKVALMAKQFVSFDYNGYSYVLRTGSMIDRSKNQIKLKEIEEQALSLKKWLVNGSNQYAEQNFWLLYLLIMETEFPKDLSTRTMKQLRDNFYALYDVAYALETIRIFDKNWMFVIKYLSKQSIMRRNVYFNYLIKPNFVSRTQWIIVRFIESIRCLVRKLLMTRR